MVDEAIHEKQFPIQLNFRGESRPCPTKIPWSLAEEAYSIYSSKYGTSQTLECLAHRGGFHTGEMDEFVPDWRERCDTIHRLEAENADLKARIERLLDTLHEAREAMKEIAEGCALSANAGVKCRPEPILTLSNNTIAAIDKVLNEEK